jgi:hypothetical protein
MPARILAADVYRQNAVVAFEDPGRRKLHHADQPCVIRIVADRHEIDPDIICLEQNLRAADGELADAVFAHPAADNDALGFLPGLFLQERTDDEGKFLRKILDDGVHDSGFRGVAFGQNFVEFLLADVAAGAFAKRILALFGERLSPFIEQRIESLLAGAIAQEAPIVLQLEIVTIHIHARQPGSAVGAGQRCSSRPCRRFLLCHIPQTGLRARSKRPSTPSGSIGVSCSGRGCAAPISPRPRSRARPASCRQW